MVIFWSKSQEVRDGEKIYGQGERMSQMKGMWMAEAATYLLHSSRISKTAFCGLVLMLY